MSSYNRPVAASEASATGLNAPEAALLQPLEAGIDHLRGPDAAAVILEYGDYECPYSRRAFREIERVERAMQGAKAAGTPFISFFTPAQMLALAREAGFSEVRHVSAAALTDLYFAGRTDGLCPPKGAEELLVAVT